MFIHIWCAQKYYNSHPKSKLHFNWLVALWVTFYFEKNNPLYIKLISHLPSISNQWPVRTHMHTMKTANEKERSSAPVNRPHTPNEILQINTYYMYLDWYEGWYLWHFRMATYGEHITGFSLWLINYECCAFLLWWETGLQWYKTLNRNMTV
jgi:hypothetical protein